MNGETEQIDKQLRTLKIIALTMLVGAPATYLIIAQIISQTCEPKAGQELMLYLLLMVAIGSPAFVPIIAQSQIRTWRTSQVSAMTPMNLFFTLSIIGMAFVNSIYIFGMISYLLTGEFVNMLYFYPVGIAWSFVHWPKREKYNQLVERLSRP